MGHQLLREPGAGADGLSEPRPSTSICFSAPGENRKNHISSSDRLTLKPRVVFPLLFVLPLLNLFLSKQKSTLPSLGTWNRSTFGGPGNHVPL